VNDDATPVRVDREVLYNRRLLWVIAGLVTIIAIRTVVFACCPPKMVAWDEEGPDDERGDSVGGLPDTMRLALNDTLTFDASNAIRIRGTHNLVIPIDSVGLTILPPP
jgi:hypothetical protein